MVDKITNSLINLENKASKNSANVKNSISKVDNYGSENSASIKINQKSVVSDLASSAPIDHDKVSSIKKAISSGNYPLDLDKISDALMEAYNEMKS
jgi:negative regulator of flagellin synthesis FlgM